MSQIPPSTFTQIQSHVDNLCRVDTSICWRQLVFPIFVRAIHIDAQPRPSLRLMILWSPRPEFLGRMAVTGRQRKIRIAAERATPGGRPPAKCPVGPVVRRGALALVPTSRARRLFYLLGVGFPRATARAAGARQGGVQEEASSSPRQAAATPVALC